VISVWLLN